MARARLSLVPREMQIGPNMRNVRRTRRRILREVKTEWRRKSDSNSRPRFASSRQQLSVRVQKLLDEFGCPSRGKAVIRHDAQLQKVEHASLRLFLLVSKGARVSLETHV